MKKTLSTLLLILAALVGSSTAILAQVQRDTVFALSQTDQRFLSYYVVNNVFDSATVLYRVGELTVRDGSGIVRIKPTATSPYNAYIQAAGGTEVQTRLDSMMRWNVITLPSGPSELRFYRQIGVVVMDPTDRSTPVSWDLPERSTFVLQARDPDNDTLMWMADSVFAEAGSTWTAIGPFGTEPLKSYRSVSVPPGMWGKTIRFTLKPKRTLTSTPFGMIGKIESSNINLSLTNYDYPNGFASMADYDTLMNRRFRAWLAWADALYSAYCLLPYARGTSLNDYERNVVRSTFYEVDTVNASNDTVWVLKNCVGDSCGSLYKGRAVYNGQRHIGDVMDADLAVDNVIRTNDEIIITVTRRGKPLTVDLTAFLIDGRDVTLPTLRSIPVGTSTLSLNISGAPQGPVFVLMRDESSRALVSLKLPPR